MTTFTEKRAGIIGLIGASAILISIEIGGAQQSKLTGEIAKKEWFQKLPVRTRMLADSAVWLANDSKYQESIKTLRTVLAMPETKKANRFFRAWLHQWMAYNFSPTGNLDTTRFFVRSSLKADFDIWPDKADSRLPIEVRGLYQDCREEILTAYFNKRKNYRIAVGPITRGEFGFSSGFFDLAFGAGTTVVLTKELERIVTERETEFFKDMLVFVRLQKMRKNIKRLTAGVYAEFGLYSTNFFSKKSRPAKALSGGPIISYAYPSGTEVGLSFEAARLNFGENSITRFSSTYSDLTIGNFEIYFRKWF